MASKSKNSNSAVKSTSTTLKFSDGKDVARILESIAFEDVDGLVDVISALRNQLSPPSAPLGSRLQIPADDLRLILSQGYLSSSPGCPQLLQIWDSAYTSSSSLHPPSDALRLLVPLLSLLANLLDLLSSQYLYHQHGHAILKALLVPLYTKRLSVYISSGGNSSAELVLVSMRLWVAMAEFAGGREKQKVVESFGWDHKVVMKLLAMRRKAKLSAQNALERPDIRTLTLAFLLSPLSPSSSVSTAMKQTYVSTSPYVDALSLIWKGIESDDPLVIRYVLERLWEGLWSDKTIPRKDKIALFNERVINELIKIYNRTEEVEGDLIPSELIHHFLLAVCTRPGVGVCFRDRGWYPRETQIGVDGVLGSELAEEADTPNGDDKSKGPLRGKIYNKILANVLKMLKVNEDAKQQELALKILAACPELVAGYWSVAGLTLEPRLSSRWITNIGFAGAVISLPVPEQTFIMPLADIQLSVSGGSALYYPTPPPLSIIMENVVPSTISTKANLTKVLLGGSGVKSLVQHCAALVLVKCLDKLRTVLAVWRRVEDALGESKDIATGQGELGDVVGGQWTSRRSEIIREARKRLPDFQVIQAFARQTELSPAESDNGAKVRKALLGEVAQRLVWMYHRCLPDAVIEAKFDVGKLLGNLVDDCTNVGGIELDASQKFSVVTRLHILRLLKEADQFVLNSKTSSASQTNFYLLMKVYINTSVPAIRALLHASLSHLLSQTLVFQTNGFEAIDSNESALWLKCLPTMRRAEGAQTVDGTPLTNEGEGLVNFLDDCFGRCQKRVYGYIEEMHTLVKGEKHAFPSPLLMAILEQLKSKIEHQLLTPSDTLAIVTFIRKLVLQLMGHLPDLVFLTTFVNLVDQLFGGAMLHTKAISTAVNREVRAMKTYLSRAAGSTPTQASTDVDSGLSLFLSKIESSTSSTSPARIHAAYEVVDYIRLMDGTLGAADLTRCIRLIEACHAPALKDLSETIDITSCSLWNGLDNSPNDTVLATYLSFELLYMHTDIQRLRDQRNQRVLVDTLTRGSNIANIKRAIRLISHSLPSPESRPSALSLLAMVLQTASDSLSEALYLDLKEYLFTSFQALKDLCTDAASDDALDHLFSCLQYESPRDRAIVADITAYWIATLRSVASDGPDDVSRALKWIRFAEPDQLLNLLDFIGEGISDTPNKPTVSVLRTVITALKDLLASEVSLEDDLRTRLPQLLALRPVLSGFYDLEDVLATAIEASLPLGHDGHDARHKYLHVPKAVSLSVWAQRAQSHWTHRKDTLPSDLDIKSFLFQTSWASSTVRIICSLLYRHVSPKQVFIKWVKTDNCAHRSTHDFALVLHAFMDALICRREEVPDIEGDAWLPHFTRLVRGLMDSHRPQEMRDTCSWCVATLLSSVPAKHSQFTAILTKEVDGADVSSSPRESLVVASRLRRLGTDSYSELINTIVAGALQWLVGYLGDEGDGSEEQEVATILTSLISPSLKSHLIEPLLTVVTKAIPNAAVLSLSSALVSAVPLKPVVVNRFLQNILQNPQFYGLCRSPPRDAIIRLLHTLFHLHPANTCQPTHIAPLIRVYRGTLCVSDQQILSIFRLFEAQRSTSVASLLATWSSSPDLSSTDALEAIQSLDPGKVLKTCLAFPRWRRLDNEVVHDPSSSEKQLYDPVFLMLLFSQSQSESPPTSTLAWVELFRTNIVCLAIRALSSKDDKLREIAILQVTTLWTSLQNADMQEKSHVVYLLNLLKDTFDAPTDQPIRRLPSYSTLILVHALRAIFYPSNFIYPLTSSFLLQRPELDTKDIPMLYGMLYSSSDNWKKERGWIIRFLSDGMISSDDWRVLKRRHTWDLLASLYQSSENDRALRYSILEVLANFTCNVQATTSLLLKSSLLSWVEMQLSSCRNLEAIAWIKILENIMAIVDSSKIESATDGGWRDSISRCLLKLLTVSSKPPAPNILHIIAPVILRLSCLPGPSPANMQGLVKLSLDYLDRIEVRAKLPHLAPVHKVELRSLTPQPSAGLFDLNEPPDDLSTWGGTIECLWRVSMAITNSNDSWDALTSRLLVWRSVVGEDVCDIGEWARREVATNL